MSLCAGGLQWGVRALKRRKEQNLEGKKPMLTHTNAHAPSPHTARGGGWAVSRKGLQRAGAEEEVGREEGSRLGAGGLLVVQGRACWGGEQGLGSLGEAGGAGCACRSTHPTMVLRQQSPARCSLPDLRSFSLVLEFADCPYPVATSPELGTAPWWRVLLSCSTCPVQLPSFYFPAQLFLFFSAMLKAVFS